MTLNIKLIYHDWCVSCNLKKKLFLSGRIKTCVYFNIRNKSKKICTDVIWTTNIYDLWRKDTKCEIWTLNSLQAIASRNRLKSVAKQRESQQQQLRALITERRAELERSVFILHNFARCSKFYRFEAKASPTFISTHSPCNIANAFLQTTKFVMSTS